MARRVTPTTFWKWLCEANGKAATIDKAGDKVLNSLENLKKEDGAKVWRQLAEIPELAILTKNALFKKEISIFHHAIKHGNEIYGEEQRFYAIAGLKTPPLR